MAVAEVCLLVGNHLPVRAQLRPVVMKRIQRGHPGQEAMLDVSNYLWLPHMHKDIVRLVDECRDSIRYSKNAKNVIPIYSYMPLPLFTHPGQEAQIDYAGPLEDHKGKHISISGN